MNSILFKRIVPFVMVALIAAWLWPMVTISGGKETAFVHLTDGYDIYKAACASCHGMDGTGNDQAHVVFQTALPDFSDCNFTSREPAADWVGVAHDGGPVRGFDQLMPAFGDVLTVPQLETVVGYVKDFCDDPRWPDGAFNLPKAQVTGKAYPEDEYLFQIGSNIGEPVDAWGKIIVEKRVGSRHQLELMVPFHVKQVETLRADGTADYRLGEGIGDIALAYKFTFLHSLKTGTIASIAGEVFLPTGDEADHIGNGIFVFEPLLILNQIIPVVGFVYLQVGAEISTDKAVASHEMLFRGAYGRSFQVGQFGRIWSPIVELLGAREIEKGADVKWDVLPQLQVTLNQRQHIMLNIGTRIPVSDFKKENIQIMAYLLWDWFDGGFTEGW